ncbi:4-hydroxybenzoate polyprenyl transferase [Plasmodium falciparum UGT5.1]|uniref:Para-hydroxybenzoate-polyprenyltransferase n=3 Tax=Plasmodium falciparum TaxID=5833 RepID=A0A0L1IGH1_PLAFA|nr:4-hydroxybenzoate polyprenyl transferase [Plasmodium falciparum Vietnam Oak-Knoll (FVO)]EWC77911.1 4-hydroxybenzoate polyprenyl transferase [Plasmodium falciparum UGT5.1]KNG78724.1 para-hydroxybenzoate-polyprenyltransferase [Plasmodium falciparum IGH-CR14]
MQKPYLQHFFKNLKKYEKKQTSFYILPNNKRIKNEEPICGYYNYCTFKRIKLRSHNNINNTHYNICNNNNNNKEEEEGERERYFLFNKKHFTCKAYKIKGNVFNISYEPYNIYDDNKFLNYKNNLKLYEHKMITLQRCYYSEYIDKHTKNKNKELYDPIKNLQKYKHNNDHNDDNNNNNNNKDDIYNSKMCLQNKLRDMLIFNIKNYIILSRLHIPAGIYLLFYSSLYGYFLTYDMNNLLINNNILNMNEIQHILKNIGLFLFGSINTRITGCIINDLLDKNFDKQVERTKNRPIANKNISVHKAIIYACIHGTLSLLTLFQFNSSTIYTGLYSTFFIFTYPLFKRLTYYAQVYLSLTFNLGYFISASININLINNIIPIIVGFLPLSFLTIIYDTIYAHQDKKDDIRLKLKSLAIKWDKNTLKYSKVLSLNMLLFLYLSSYLFDMHFSYYIFSTFNIMYLYYILDKVSLNDKQKCMTFFKKSKNVLFFMVLATILSKASQVVCKNEENNKKKKGNIS